MVWPTTDQLMEATVKVDASPGINDVKPVVFVGATTVRS
jgi:hypothetical protein